MDTIVTNHQRLSVISRETTWEEVNDLDLLNRLKKAAGTAWTKAAGLSAIQIGIPLRFSWYKWGEDEFTLMNPKILEFKGKCKRLEEGCLSIPKTWLKIPRYYKIKYMNDGKVLTAKGYHAQIIQHEIDHMNGILITHI